MNLSNFKESFDKVVSAADMAYDPQAMANVSDKVQEFASNGEALGKKLVDFFKKDRTDEDDATLRKEPQSRSSSDLPSNLPSVEDLENNLLERIRQDVDIQIDDENKEIIINSGALTDETTDALREYLALKGNADEAWKTPDLMIEEGVHFHASTDETLVVGATPDYPDFKGMSFGKLEIQSQDILNADRMFAGVSADEIVLADQPNLESADSMFGFAQVDNISIGKLPGNIDVSFDLMRDCPSDVNVAGTMYKVSDATKADIEEKLENGLYEVLAISDGRPRMLPNKPPKDRVDEPHHMLPNLSPKDSITLPDGRDSITLPNGRVISPGKPTEQGTTMEINKTATRGVMADYELGVDTMEQTEGSSVGLEK